MCIRDRLWTQLGSSTRCLHVRRQFAKLRGIFHRIVGSFTIITAMYRTLFFSALLLALALALASRDPSSDPRLSKASRIAERNGWIQVHLEGSPAEIGFQHGFLLADEIEDTFKVISAEFAHDEKRDWAFFRSTARDIFWPHVEEEYRAELNGIAEGCLLYTSRCV